MKYRQLIMFSFFGLVVSPSHAVPNTIANSTGFTLLNAICVDVEGETPILLSDIEKRAQQKNINFKEARTELTRERLLWVIAKKQLKYDLGQINQAADEHLKKIMENLKISKEKFAELLMAAPYLTTPKQFQMETAWAILENNFKATLASQISITDEQVKQQIARNHEEVSDQFDVVFVSVVPEISSKGTAPNLTAQLKKANEIKAKIKTKISLDTVKKIYEQEKNVSIIGPLAYEKGGLNQAYERELAKSRNAVVTEPFRDEGAVTMIWKMNVSTKLLGSSSLEKVRKELYDKAVMEKYQAITDAMMNSSTVVVKDCQAKRR